MELKIGQSCGHYKILSLIGIGGMGEVYLAEDVNLHRKVALKFLPKELTDDKDKLTRFEQEARAVSALNHQNILTIYEFGKENGMLFFAMEYVKGMDLGKKLKAGPLPISEALNIASQVASALSAAHETGIIHRDIKPDNIMVRDDGFVKVLDFGIAKLIEVGESIHSSTSESPTRAHLNTIEGAVIGTANYMSPEQARGKKIDARTDIFSLGVVLYEMLAGTRPFTGESAIDTMSAILKDEPVEITEINPKISRALAKVVRICLEKTPERRFHTAHDLVFALDAVSATGISGQDTAIVPTPVTSEKSKIYGGGSRTPWLVAAICGAIALGAVILAAYLYSGRQQTYTFRQLNFRRESVFQAEFAPDGKTVVYSGATDGNTPEIFTVHPDFPAPQTVGLRGMHLLDVSSKGELAVLMNAQYMRHRTFVGKLARLPLVGGAPREILDGVRQADWSPDGSELAIIREVDGKDRLEYPIGKVLCEVSGNLSDLRISPDGKQIALFEHPVKNDDRGSVDIIDLAGNKTMLCDGYWSERGLAWSADGSEVWFSASESGGDYAIFAVTPGGKRHIVEQAPGGLILQDIAADGRLLAYRLDYRYGVIVHSPGMEEDRDLSWLRTSKTKLLSQDGQFVVFSEHSLGTNYAVCLRKTDGSPVVRLGDGRPMDLSPDGKWVAAVIPSKPQELVAYPTGAGETLHFDRGSMESYASAQWFRDGKRLLVGGNETGKGARIYIQDVGGAARAVTPEGTREGRLSPDGKHILARGAEGKYFLYPVDGGEPRLVGGLTEADIAIQWSADSRSVFVYQGTAVPCKVELVNVETGRRELFKEMAPQHRTGVLSVRPTFITDDQRSYTYTTYSQVSSLFVSEARK